MRNILKIPIHAIIRLKPYALSLIFYSSRFIPLFLFAAGLYAYTATLAPTVLEGDKALFQYTPYVLGVTYPTGFPLYILLSKLWLTVFPFGEIAWRMNLLSALCAALTLPLLYGVLRRLLANRWAALAAVLTLATLPTFWHWSTVAKTYPLSLLLLTIILYIFAISLVKQSNNPDQNSKFPLVSPLSSFIRHPSSFILLLLGLQISVHNTAVLLIPGLALLVWLNFRPYLRGRNLWLALLALALPSLFYLYIPLRGDGLIAAYGRNEAIQRGLLADFYRPGLDGLVEYFLAAKFTGGIVTKWSLLPQRFVEVYLPLLKDNLTLLGIGLAVVGGLALALRRPRLFWPLFLIYAVPIPFVLTYDQGEQAAFLLPSFLVCCIFVGNVLNIPIAAPHISRITYHVSRFAPAILCLVLIPLLFMPQIRYNLNWLNKKWDRAIYNEWDDALSHPLTPNAALLASWGDLTPFWYMQYAEGRRPDLRGLYPPTEAIVAGWLATGHDLYIAGPLPAEAESIQQRYHLIPWGRLVRLASFQAAPESLLPDLPHRVETALAPPGAGQAGVRFIGADLPVQAVGGAKYPVTLTWQALADLPPETTLSLRLSQGDKIAAQLDDPLLSGWFPNGTLAAGQYGLSYAPLSIPLGTLPGRYRLQLAAYTDHNQPWLAVDKSPAVELGEVEVISPPPDYQPTLTGYTLPGYDFNGEIELAEYNYSVTRVGQGKGFAVRLLWRAGAKPADNYTLEVEQLDPAGQVIRTTSHQPPAPTGAWQAGQFVRDQVDLIVPASAPPGDDALRLQLKWRRTDGATLTARRWLIPIAAGLTLKGPAVVEKEGRVFTAPPLSYGVGANLGDKARLLGYTTPGQAATGRRFEGQVSQKECAASTEACLFRFDFYWQGVNEMEQPYLVFLHVVNAQGQIVTQLDHAPGQRGKQPTTAWLPGEVVTDPVEVRLPGDISPGTYTLRLGLYLPPAGPRLPVLDEAGQPTSDFVEVGVIRVGP